MGEIGYEKETIHGEYDSKDTSNDNIDQKNCKLENSMLLPSGKPKVESNNMKLEGGLMVKNLVV